MEEYQSLGEVSGFIVNGNAKKSCNLDKNQNKTRKRSFVWKYFRPINGTKTYECVICNGCVGSHTASNLARHISALHNITKETEQGVKYTRHGRPSRSFIWKYCTKEDSKHARCHLCQKLLFFGGGNTANINKHLRRKHLLNTNNNMDIFEENKKYNVSNTDIMKVEIVNSDGDKPENHIKNDSIDLVQDGVLKKERRGASYVWTYCEKVSRHTIRCKLCNKIMSFHGTANIITHLQRRHNVISSDGNGIETENGHATTDIDKVEEPLLSEQGDYVEMLESGAKRHRRSWSTSVVWKYCKRIATDVVRCGFCKKNLSYQGTSNLQRHLHRMHGVVIRGRISKVVREDNVEQFNDTNFIWEHCSLITDGRVKCNMCPSVFNSKQTEEISKHLTINHAVQPHDTGKRQSRRRVNFSEVSSDYDKDDFIDSNSKPDDNEDVRVTNTHIKNGDAIYGDIIEEDHEQISYDEDPFDPNLLHELPLVNPISARSSLEGSPKDDSGARQKESFHNKNMQKLTEDRMRMETEYFREKAGFYRMQKYLTALQAKKIRLEIERLNSNNNLNGSSYSVNIDEMSSSLQNLPTTQ